MYALVILLFIYYSHTTHNNARRSHRHSLKRPSQKGGGRLPSLLKHHPPVWTCEQPDAAPSLMITPRPHSRHPIEHSYVSVIFGSLSGLLAQASRKYFEEGGPSPCFICCSTITGSTYRLSSRAGSQTSDQGSAKSYASCESPSVSLMGSSRCIVGRSCRVMSTASCRAAKAILRARLNTWYARL